MLNDKKPKIVDFKNKWNIDKSIGEKYQNLCKKELKKELGSFYTPYEVVDFMVKEMVKNIDFEKNPYIKILDPSCGGGYFLLSIIENLKHVLERLEIKNPVEHLLKNNIYGFDIDKNAVMITQIEIYDRTGYKAENIKCKDFLIDSSESFDVIIGNPPYMGHKVLTGEYRETLYNLYKEVFSDKGDMSYCFIKKSIDCLNEGGNLIFFTSRYILEALNGKNIRSYIRASGGIKRIIDFYGIRLVKGAGVDNIILDYFKGKNYDNIDFFRLKPCAKGMGKKVFEDIENTSENYTRYIKVDSHTLNDDGWSFLSPVERNILSKIKGVELSSVCESYQGIITGCDDAFVLSLEDADRLKIEKDILKPWIKGKNIDRFNVTPSNELLIYSDLIHDESKFANALNFIGKHKERLENRRECKKGVRKWYELQWGRKKEVFEGRKIVYPYKSSRNRFSIDEGSFFSADVYVIKIMDMFKNSISYEFLVGVLNSSIYEFYIKTIAKKLGDDLYEYYPNKIMTLKIPEYIREIEDEVLNKNDDIRDRVDKILMKHFGITDDEYKVIKDWCI
jgi:adenine-specific DNA-methyltransferase